MTTKKMLIAKKRLPKKAAKRGKAPHTYQTPKTAAELGIVCAGGNSKEPYGLLVIWFDYEIGEKNHKSGFVCDEHKVSNRVEKLAQPTAARVV